MSSSRDEVPGSISMFSGNGPHGFGAGRPWPVEPTPARAAVWLSYTIPAQTPRSTSGTRCLATPS